MKTQLRVLAVTSTAALLAGLAAPVVAQAAEVGTHHPTTAYRTAVLVRQRHSTAHRVDPESIWRLAKNKYDHVPAPSRASISVNRPSGIGFVTGVGARKAARLARIVNHLNTFPAGVLLCPRSRPHDNDVIRFHTRKGLVVVRVQASGCRRVTIGVGSHRGRPLRDVNGRLNHAVRRVVG